MRPMKVTRWLTASLTVAATCSLVLAEEPRLDRYGEVVIDNAAREGLEVGDQVFPEWAPEFVQTGYLQDQPAPMPPPQQPAMTLPSVTQAPAGLQGGLGLGGLSQAETLSATRQQEASAASASVTSGSESQVRNTTDTGDLLGNSATTLGVVVQSRNPIQNDVRIRSYRYGDITSYAGGGMFVPIRYDFDSALSKIDSSIVQNVVTVKGPYTVRQGPGLAFIDIALLATPRYQNGFEVHGRTYGGYDTNGNQYAFRQTFFGGNSDWGFRIGYGQRGGSDYVNGIGQKIASSYKSRDVDLALSFDLSNYSTIDFNYLRIDQTDVEMAGLPGDLTYFVTDAFMLRYLNDAPAIADHFVASAWYNQSRLGGTSRTKDPAAFPGFVMSDSSADIASSGYRSMLTWGDAGDSQFSVGTDWRYYQQEWTDVPFNASFRVLGVPKSHYSNPGLFTDTVLPTSSALTMRAGARVDWISVSVEEPTKMEFPAGTPIISNAGDQDYTTFATYLAGDYVFNDAWTGHLAYGYGQRAPTPSDLFSFFQVVSYTQNAFGPTFINSPYSGFPGGVTSLGPAYAQQIDLAADMNYQNMRGNIHAYYSWIDNFISLTPNGGGEINPVNRDVSIWGIESYSEYDLTQRLLGFASLAYTEAQDKDQNIPLWGVWPLYSYVGLRFVEENYALEFGAHIVADQNRVDPNFELPTAGYSTFDIRGAFKLTDRLLFTAGVENLTDRNYLTHLDSRLNFNNAAIPGVFRPGRNYYFGLEANY